MLKCFHKRQDKVAVISQETEWTQNAFPGDTGLSCNAFRGGKIIFQQFHKVQDKDAVEWIMENEKQEGDRKKENGKAGLSSHLPKRVSNRMSSYKMWSALLGERVGSVLCNWSEETGIEGRNALCPEANATEYHGLGHTPTGRTALTRIGHCSHSGRHEGIHEEQRTAALHSSIC